MCLADVHEFFIIIYILDIYLFISGTDITARPNVFSATLYKNKMPSSDTPIVLDISSDELKSSLQVHKQLTV